ncbi:ferritin-like domain-containing protein [Gelidibacter maritimus]|uniref:PA2169 family four-helix-bundle protein n=1 Tax=Gelidibacter maritimus TaxID=2761487 RepID=A0A7W2M3L8_9FLAO|nr:PA2169 family four-helix-bundle protein [Gelidibacter maritimus]MBA6152042.1 PA2169 family four-helix-bundle protein [Gelidibacter maritimus]
MKTTLERARQKTNENNIDVLQAIIEKNYDARQGYRKAMMDVQDPELKNFMQQQARQRSNFTNEIDQQIRNLGDTPIENGSMAATLHRTWIDIKTRVASNADETIIEEVIRGEKAKVKEYKDALKNNLLAPQTHNLLQSQLKAIKNTLQDVKHFNAN